MTIRIRVGYELIYDCPQPTPMVLMLNIHHTRAGDIVVPDRMVADPSVPMTAYRDGFGNWCTRIVAPKGRTRVSADAIVRDTGMPDVVAREAQQFPVQDLPEETLLFLLGSRYCETDRLSETAWNLFGTGPTGWDRVQAVCDYVHRHITFGYEHARMTRTAISPRLATSTRLNIRLRRAAGARPARARTAAGRTPQARRWPRGSSGSPPRARP